MNAADLERHHLRCQGIAVALAELARVELAELEVQEAEEPAAEPEAEGDGILRLKVEGAVVEAEFLQGLAQQPVLVGLHRIQPGEDHGLDVLEARQRVGGRVLGRRDEAGKIWEDALKKFPEHDALNSTVKRLRAR